MERRGSRATALWAERFSESPAHIWGAAIIHRGRRASSSLFSGRCQRAVIYSALMLNIELETRMTEARAALFEGAAEKFRTALQEIPPQALKAEWDPAPLLVDAAQS